MMIVRNPGKVIWFTGLSGSGKSTIADGAYDQLLQRDLWPVRLDGDDLRTGLNADLGFGRGDRSENLRRSGHVAKLLSNIGHLTLCSFITPFNEDRELVRRIIGEPYVEVYVRASVQECERRDPKGLYARARSGSLKEFTGVSSLFEVPATPHLTIDTEQLSVDESVKMILELLWDC